MPAEFPGGVIDSSGSVAEELFKLAEGYLNGVEIGEVRRKVAPLGIDSFNGLGDAPDLVTGEVVHDDEVARSQRRRKMLFDLAGEEVAVDRPLNAEDATKPIERIAFRKVVVAQQAEKAFARSRLPRGARP